MKRCLCGCDMFYCSQKQLNNIMVDGNREWKKSFEGFPLGGPKGPYVCCNCGKEYKTWADIPAERE